MRLDRSNSRVYLSPSDVQTYWKAAPPENELMTKTQAKTSTRPSKTLELTLDDFYVAENDNVNIYVVHIRRAKNTTEDDEPKDRLSWCPKSHYQELKEWCETEGIADDEEIFPNGYSKHQKTIRETCDRLVEATGLNEWDHVTAHDFRRYWATNSYRRLQLDKDLVMDMGGWSSDEAIKPYLEERLPIDIQNEILNAETYAFVDRETPEVDIGTEYPRYPSNEYENVTVDSSLDEFAD